MPKRSRQSNPARDPVMHSAIGYAMEEKLRQQTRAGPRFIAVALAVLSITVAVSAWFVSRALDDIHNDHELVKGMVPKLDDVQHRVERIENIFLSRSFSRGNDAVPSQNNVPLCGGGTGCGGYVRSRPASRSNRLARQPDPGASLETSATRFGMHDGLASDVDDSHAAGGTEILDHEPPEVR